MLRSKLDQQLARNRLLTYVFVSILLLYFIFAPAIHILYYGGEDLHYTFGGFDKSCSTDDGYYFMRTLGRPFQAQMDCLSYKFAYTMERMVILRAISVGLMALAVALFADVLFDMGLAFWTSFFAAGAIVLIPHLYGDAVTIAATSLPVSVLLAVLAYRCVNRSHRADAKNGRRWCLLAGVLTLLALLTYPATTFFYAALMLAKVLFSPLSNWQKTRRETIREALVFLGVCVIYFAWAYYNMHYHAQAPVPDQYHVDKPNLSVTEIFTRLAILSNVFNSLWQFFPGGDFPHQGWFILTVLIAGMLAGAGSFINRLRQFPDAQTRWLYLGQAVLLAAILILLSSAFFLAIPIRDMGSRLAYGPITAGLVLLIWCLYRVTDVLPANTGKMTAAIAIGLFFLFKAHYTNMGTLDTALNAGKRMSYIQDQLLQSASKGKSIKRIHFILRQPDYPYNHFFQANGALIQILGHNNYELRWCSLARGVPGAEKDHQKEMHACLNKLPPNGIGVTYSYFNEPYAKTRNMVVIRNDNNQI